MNENSQGEWGCSLYWKTIQKRLELNEEAWLKDKEQQVEWFLEQQRSKQ